MQNWNIRTHERKVFPTAQYFIFDQYVYHSKTNTVILENLLNNLLIQDTKKDVVIRQIQKVDHFHRKQLLHQQKCHDKQYMPLSVTYSRALPNLKYIQTKHGYILQINQSCEKTFSTFPVKAFTKDTSLKQIIGTNNTHNKEKLIKTENNHHTRKCVLCNSTRCLCCRQLISTTILKSNQANKKIKIYHKVICKNSFVICFTRMLYLQHSILWQFRNFGHSTLGSITTKKMSKIPVQYPLANISTGTMITLTDFENS